MDRNSNHWAQHEFRHLKLGDSRLDDRATSILTNALAQPSAPINQAQQDSIAAKAAYRFFRNPKVTPEKIFSSHQYNTALRIQGHQRILVLQDSCFYNFNSHLATDGLGHIGTGSYGLVQHHALAVTTNGLPLGKLYERLWSRTGKKNKQRQLEPLEEKESYKWIEALEQCQLNAPIGTELIHVGDAESDFFEFFLHAKAMKAKFLVRSSWARKIADSDFTLKDYYTQALFAGTQEVQVSRKQGEYPARVANISIYYAPVTIQNPVYLFDSRGIDAELSLWVIYAIEESPPEGSKAIAWTLLSNVDIATGADAVERVKWYQKRWMIEVYHKTIKSGCRVEDCRLNDSEKLRRYIALMGIVAWRIMWMTYISRTEPKEKCTKVLTMVEWRALHCKITGKTTTPKRVPTVDTVIKQIAQLGGYLNRRSDGPPGVITIWRGWIRLQDALDIWVPCMEL